MRTDEPDVVVEQSYRTSPSAVWRAITELNEMKQWYFDNIPAFEARVGFETEFLIVNEGREFPHLWRITEVVPGQRIAYRWRFDGYEGDGLVTFEISETDGGSHLKLTNAVLEDYPDDIPEFRRESCEAGWKYFIQERLKEYLEP